VIKKEVTVTLSGGLYMRPCAAIVELTNQFDSEIRINSDRKCSDGNLFVADGKSIMQVSSLAATFGTVLTIKADGPDEEEAIEKIVKLIENKCGFAN